MACVHPPSSVAHRCIPGGMYSATELSPFCLLSLPKLKGDFCGLDVSLLVGDR